MRKIFLLTICLFGVCFGKDMKRVYNYEPYCEQAWDLVKELLKKDYWAKGYEFLISAVILGDKKIKDLETGYYCEAAERIACNRLDFYTVYKCPDKMVYIFSEYQRLENAGAPISGNAGQPLGTK